MLVIFFAQSAALSHLKPEASWPAFGAACEVAEHFSKSGRHEVVQNGVNRWAEVKEDSGDDVDFLEDLLVLSRRFVNVAPHQAVHMEGSPAKTEDNHQHAWTTWREDRVTNYLHTVVTSWYNLHETDLITL